MARYVDTALVLALGTSLWLGGCRLSERTEDGKQGYRAAEYSLGGRPVKLSGGVSEIQAAPGSAAKISTRYFGNEVTHDLNGDGRPDVVFLLTQETGGTGVFYYVVAALNTPHGFVGSEGLLLGDRIAPQTIEIGTNDLVIVNYADRAPGESFATPPSVGKSLWLKLDARTLQFAEVAQNFEGEAEPARMMLGMKTWIWVSTGFATGEQSAPKRADAFTITFGDGTFTATTDCNRMTGAYTVAGNRLTFSAVAATRMYCEGSQEGEFTAFLTATAGYHFTSRGQLVLELGPGSGSAVFR